MVLGAMPTRPALLVRIKDTNGCEGWGEVWANFPPRANIHKAHIVEEVIAPHLNGLRVTAPREVTELLRRALSTYFLHAGQCSVFEHILAGIDTALWDLALRSIGQSFAEFMSLEVSSALTYASSINPADLEQLMSDHSEYGQSKFKLKIGIDNEQDLRFVTEASKIRPPGTQLMVDSNQAWDLDSALKMLSRFEEFQLNFAEEPISANAGVDQWERLAKATSIPLACGENLYGISQFMSMANSGIGFIQPDVSKWGGVTGALELAGVLPSGVELWPHFMGTAVGQMAALSIAAVIGETSLCEVDVNTNPLRSDLCGNALTIEAGRILLPDDPGLVIPPSRERLDEFRDRAY